MKVVMQKFQYLGVAMVVVLTGLIGCSDLGLVGDQGFVSTERSCSSDSNCIFDGVPNRSLGGAKLSLNGDGNLIIDNIGSSGMDGVRQYGIPNDTVLMTTGLACPNFVESVEGSKMVIVMYGDVPGEIISTMTIENVDGQVIEERSDMSMVGVTKYRVEILLDNEIVATFEDMSDPVLRILGAAEPGGTDTTTAQVSTTPTDFDGISCGVHWWGIWHYGTFTFRQTVNVSEGGGDGGTTVIGDAFRVAGTNQTITAHVQSAFDNFFTNMGTVEMDFQSIAPEIDEMETP